MSHSSSPIPTFKSLEQKRPRQGAFWISVGFHIVMLSAGLLIPLWLTDTLTVDPYDWVLIVPPPQPREILEVTPYRMPPPVERPAEKPLVAPPPSIPTVVQHTPRTPEPEELAAVEAPAPIDRRPKMIESPPEGPLEAPRPAVPRPEVRTGAFSNGSSAKPTVDLAARQVQTGGFGDPNGVRGQGKPDKIANVASLGSFDLPTGPGAGNGTGGANGVRGVVASAGFGNGAASTGKGNGGNGGSRSVRQGGFGDSQPAAPAEPRRQAAVVRETPVEITYKPKPDYTAEARSKKIEGEVTLRIEFGANGQVRVLELVRGLGHGLDENARRAARQIRFKPAMRDGAPIDSIATVHIVFQMAY